MKLSITLFAVALGAFLVTACDSADSSDGNAKVRGKTGVHAPACDSPQLQKGAAHALDQGILAAGGVVGMVAEIKTFLPNLEEYASEDAEDMKHELRRKLKITSADGVRLCRKEWSPGSFLMVVAAVSPESSDEVGYIVMNFGVPNAVGYYGWVGD